MLNGADRVTPQRLRSLDGLRGLAAAIVVLHHAGLLNPGISDFYLSGAAPAPGSFAALVIRTPVQLLFSGQEAVLIFFVLSGLVVAIPALDRSDFSWIAYYPRRVIRLIVPVVASVVLAAVMVAFTLRDPAKSVSGWASSASFSQLDWAEVVRSFDVLVSADAINNPLWSLRYELLFSLMLPIYVVVAVIAGRRWWIAVVGAGLVILLGTIVGDPVWVYLPVFLLGTVAAVRRRQLADLVDRIPPRWKNLLGAGLLLLGLVLLETRYIGDALRPGSQTVAWISRPLSVGGAAVIVVMAMIWTPLERALELEVVAWLGRISFSLYLVHMPILVAASWVLRGLPGYWTPIVGIPVSILVAVLFYRLIEAPSHRLSQRVGRAVDARFPSTASTGV